MRCCDLMTTTVVTCGETDSALRCAVLMKEHRVGFVPVVDSRGRLAGVVTDRDIVTRIVAEQRPATTELRQVMTRDVVTCESEDELRTAEARMSDRGVSRIVVVGRNRECVGVLSLPDVLRVEESSRAGELLRSIAARDSAPPPSFR